MNFTFEAKGGFLVRERVCLSEHLQNEDFAVRVPAASLSHEIIFAQYQGFDGNPWPEEDINIEGIKLKNGLASEMQYEAVLSYYKRISKKYNCDIIYCQFSDLSSIKSIKNFCFQGYDYGYFISEFNYYSSLFSEVIYGNYEKMRCFAAYLKDNMLFSSLNIVKQLDNIRQQMLKEGKDLENDEICEPIGIYSYEITS